MTSADAVLTGGGEAITVPGYVAERLCHHGLVRPATRGVTQAPSMLGGHAAADDPRRGERYDLVLSAWLPAVRTWTRVADALAHAGEHRLESSARDVMARLGPPEPIRLVVPRRDAAATGTRILPKSGIVASLSPQRPAVCIDYEGNLYGSAALARFADRVAQAAARHLTGYPTVARAVVAVDAVITVGTWDEVLGRVDVSDADALAEWLQCRVVDAAELEAQGRSYERARRPDPFPAVAMLQRRPRRNV
jgi:hypothetical protein